MPARRVRSSDASDTRASKDLRNLVRDLDKYADGKAVRRLLRKELKNSSDDITPAVISAIKRIPSKNQNARMGRPTLRSRLSSAAQTRIRTGRTSVAITSAVNPRRMPPGQASLPAYMEGTKPRWRHPLFGNSNRFYDQQAHPFFFSAVEPFRLRVQKDVIRVADHIKRDLES